MKKGIKVCIILFVVTVIISCSSSLAAKDEVKSKKFKKIASGVTQIDGGNINITFKKNNDAYVIGFDGCGSLGYGEKKIRDGIILKPSRIGKNVEYIYNSAYSVAYTRKKNVYFCGSGYPGEFYKCFDEYYKPIQYTPLQHPKKIKKMWLSNGTLVYGIDNNLYASGVILNGNSVMPRQKPKRILKNKLNEIKSVSVSGSYVLVHYKSGKVDIMGEDGCGKCIRKKKSSEYPYIYEKLVPLKQFGFDVKKYVVGYNNIGAIKKNGDFYIWGSNEQGFLCDKSLKKVSHKPKLILRNVKDVSMEYNHVLALKKDGTVWAWGENDHSYAISGSKKKVIFKPVKIASNVKQISTGLDFSVIVKNNGTAYWKGTLSRG